MSGYRHQNLKYEIRLCKGLNSSLIFQSSLKSFMNTNCKTVLRIIIAPKVTLKYGAECAS